MLQSKNGLRIIIFHKKCSWWGPLLSDMGLSVQYWRSKSLCHCYWSKLISTVDTKYYPNLEFSPKLFLCCGRNSRCTLPRHGWPLSLAPNSCSWFEPLFRNRMDTQSWMYFLPPKRLIFQRRKHSYIFPQSLRIFSHLYFTPWNPFLGCEYVNADKNLAKGSRRVAK